VKRGKQQQCPTGNQAELRLIKLFFNIFFFGRRKRLKRDSYAADAYWQLPTFTDLYRVK
jgi:hypothetical protein